MYTIVDSMRDLGRFRHWLEAEFIERPSAKELKKKKCVKCGYCCAVKPCILTPNELKIIAEFLNLTVIEAVRTYFVCDSNEDGGDNKYILPAKKSQVDILASFVDASRQCDNSYCIFFDEKTRNCKIYPVRPLMAKQQKCWEEDKTWDNEIESAILSWQDENLTEWGIYKHLI